MLEVLTKFICFLIMYFTGYLVIKKIVNCNPKITLKTIGYMLLLGVITVFLSKEDYALIYSIIILLMNIVVYKNRFKLDLSQATTVVSIFMVLLTISDVLSASLLRTLFTVEQIKTNLIVAVPANLLVGTICVLLLNIKFVNKTIISFFNNFKSKRILINVMFLIILIIGIFYLLYRFASNPIDKTYISNMVILISFSIITYIYIDSKNEYKVLSDEYDSLFNYVQNFEDWIEKEQLNRHEYKNQLAVLRTFIKDKTVISKIDGILEDSINIEDEIVNKLKELPKGGLKGLMYYKAAIAQKKRIKLVADVSLRNKTYLKKLTEEQLKTLCKLIGIYFDNSIEAAQETKSRYVLLEIYELSEKVNIVISNDFIKKDNFESRNEKGVTSKGEGHGNGLFYANNILSKNKWLESKQEIIDNYYIQTLSIKKLD